MQFVIHTHDKPDGSTRRAPLREAHHEYLSCYHSIIVARGPVLDDDASGMIGSLLIYIIDFIDISGIQLIAGISLSAYSDIVLGQ